VPEKHVQPVLLSFSHSADVFSQPCLKAKLGKTPIKANSLALAYVWRRQRELRERKQIKNKNRETSKEE